MQSKRVRRAPAEVRILRNPSKKPQFANRGTLHGLTHLGSIWETAGLAWDRPT